MLDIWGSKPKSATRKGPLAEFLSGSDVFINLPTQIAPLMVIKLSNQHSHFPNESIVVRKIYLKKV